jgi:tRNA (guanine37-N1)-methyltransferase
MSAVCLTTGTTLMKIDIVSIFVEYFQPLRLSLVGKAIEKGIVDLRVHDLRDWTSDRHRTVDDTPYGGGAGMVMRPEPWGLALDALTAGQTDPRLLVLSPSGRTFTQSLAHELAAERHLIFACGRYEGIDARVVEYAGRRMRVDELSIGDYVLSGGEAAAMVVIEAVVRLLPGVIGNPGSLSEESHAADHEGLLEGPSYTKPPSWQGLDVPEVLLSGHHERIATWRRDQAVARTRQRRPELLPSSELVIEPARPQDAGELWTLQLAAYLSEGQVNSSLSIPPLTQTLDDMRDSLSIGTVLVARRGQRLVGSVRGEPQDDQVWYIGRLMVAPDLWGEGIGGELMTAIEGCAPPGTTRLRLLTGAASERNVAYYQRRGYREVARDLDVVGVVVVIMERPI